MKSKDVYIGLPQAKDTVFGFPLNYKSLEEHTVFDRIVKPWVAKKIKEYLGVEEAAMITLILNYVKSQKSA